MASWLTTATAIDETEIHPASGGGPIIAHSVGSLSFVTDRPSHKLCLSEDFKPFDAALTTDA